MGNSWVDELDDAWITYWLDCERNGKSLNQTETSRIEGSLERVVGLFDEIRRFHQTFNEVLGHDQLIGDLLYYGVNDWHSGYRWINCLQFEEWSPSMFGAVNRLVGAPFNLERVGKTETTDAIETIRMHGLSLQSRDAVGCLRDFASSSLIVFELQNPVHFEDGIGERLQGELAQLRAMVSGVACRLPVPPGDWLTPQTSSDTEHRQPLATLHRLYCEIQKRGHIKPDNLVGKDQAGIFALRVLQRLGLYSGYQRKANENMADRVSEMISRLGLTAETIKRYVP